MRGADDALHRFERRRHALDDDELFGRRGVSDQYLQHEPVDLRFGQRVGAFGLDRVLRRHHQERLGQPVGLAPDRDLTLLHRFQQRALHFGGGAVDLVGQDEVGEDRPQRNLELTELLVVDAGADNVGGHQIGRELDALELATDRLRQRLDGHRLGQTRHTFDEQVTAREQRDDHALEQRVLSNDDALHLIENLLERHVVVGRLVHGSSRGRHCRGAPAAPPAVLIGTAKPMPMKYPFFDGLASAVTIPIT